jgi:hypothetical protein
MPILVVLICSIFALGESILTHNSWKTPKHSSENTCFTPAQYGDWLNPLEVPDIVSALTLFEQDIERATVGMFGGLSIGLVYGQTLIWSKGYGLINMSDPSSGQPTQGCLRCKRR